MAFSEKTLETLLYMDEGPTLDFKREQYRFYGATKDHKSELLKDILAFVNTSRYRTAYILLGVEEVRGEPNKIVGINLHLEDADLHQFVNSKTNRAAEFTYFPFVVGSKHIGVLRIPIQLRPVYVEKRFGKVDANKVYIRDGSSTRPASPDEIVAMGRGTPQNGP
ncbi:MAG: ATP-binding protein [Chloroflexota bacterium]|nr:ATP-binding protein [Chloroflexota bacterium]